MAPCRAWSEEANAEVKVIAGKAVVVTASRIAASIVAVYRSTMQQHCRDSPPSRFECAASLPKNLLSPLCLQQHVLFSSLLE